MKSVNRCTALYSGNLCLLLVLLLLAVPAHGYGSRTDTAQSISNARTYKARLHYLLDAAVREGLPGVSLRVRGPGIDLESAAGVADLYTGEPLTTDHAVYTASLGKTFTATVALQLCDEGVLDLEAPVTTWLPREMTQRIPSIAKITLRHLLSHTSGLADYMNDDKAWRSDFVRDPHRRWTHEDVAPYLFDRPLLFEPGTDFHYSNSNYILVALIIEQLLEQPLHVLIRKRILSPLELRHTFNGHEPVTRIKRARGYIVRRGRVIDTYPWYSHYGLADSGIHATAGDLADFIESLFNDGEILSRSMRMKMATPSGTGQPPSDYGMGIYVQYNPWGSGYLWYAHDGIDPGYQADMMYLPQLDLTIVLSANASMGRASIIYEKLLQAVVRTALNAVRQGVS